MQDLRKRPRSLETRRKISLALKGTKHSKESIARAAESNRGKKRSEEYKARMSFLFSGREMSAKSKKKMSLAKLGRPLSQEHKDKIRSGMIKLCSNPVLRERRRDQMLHGGLEKRHATNLLRYGRADGNFRDTWIEKEAKSVLNKMGLNFVSQVGFCGTVVDFLLVDLKLVVETDGCYYHGCQTCYPGIKRLGVEKESRVRKAMHKKGYSLFRIWEHDADEFEGIFSAWLFENRRVR